MLDDLNISAMLTNEVSVSLERLNTDRPILIYQNFDGPNYKYVFTALVIMGLLIVLLLYTYCRSMKPSSPQTPTATTAPTITPISTQISVSYTNTGFTNTGFTTADELPPSYNAAIDGRYPAVKLHIMPETPPPKYMDQPPKIYVHPPTQE